MASVMEIVVNAQDNASGVIQGIAGTAENTGSRFDSVMTGIAAGSAVAGGAMEGFARSQQDANVQTRQIADSIGISEGSMRDLATETSNVTFPLDQVLDLMETGRQRGLQSAQALQEYATFWDLVGDATGESAVELGKSGAALAAVGIEAGNEAEAMSALGFIHRETTGSVGEFLHFLDRTGPELRELGADVDDAAAVLGVMEHELGMSGRTARQEFRTAVSESDGDLGDLLDTLGISEESFRSMRGEVAESSDVIQDNADVVADSFTPLQKLEHGVSELMMQYGGLAGAAGTLAPALLVLGPLIKGLTVVFRAFNLTLFTNPIFLVVAAIAVLIGIAALLIANWEEVTAFLSEVWETIRETAEDVWGAIRDFFVDVWNSITEFIGGAIETVKEIFLNFHPLGIIIDNWDPIRSFIMDTWNNILDFIKGIPGKITSAASGMFNGIKDAFRGAINFVIDAWNGLSFTLPSVDTPFGTIGGFTLSTPTIPRLHDGGVFRSPDSGGEGLALLRDMERVRTPEREDELLTLLRRLADREASDEFEAAVPIDLGEGIERVVDIKIRRRNQGVTRRTGAGAGRAR